MVAQPPNLSLSAKRESRTGIHGRDRRAGRPHQPRIRDELCAPCGDHRQAALRLLNRPLRAAPPKRSGPHLADDPVQGLPVLQAVWLASDPWCRKLLRAALPEGLDPHERRAAPRPGAFQEKLLGISPAPIDRLLRPARVQHPKPGLAATRPDPRLRHAVPTRSGPPDPTRPGSVEADTVAPCEDSPEGDEVHALTVTELCSGWTEKRAVWHKSAEAVRAQVREREPVVPDPMNDCPPDNGGEFLNWALQRQRTGRAGRLPWTRRRAYRKHDNAHGEQQHWTHVRPRCGHPELVALRNDLSAQEWSPFTNHFKPTFKPVRREKQNGKTQRIDEKQPQTP